MHWIRAKEKLPADQEEVLIRYSGIFNLAVFHEKEHCFLLRDGKVCSAGTNNLQWLRLSAP